MSTEYKADYRLIAKEAISELLEDHPWPWSVSCDHDVHDDDPADHHVGNVTDSKSQSVALFQSPVDAAAMVALAKECVVLELQAYAFQLLNRIGRNVCGFDFAPNASRVSEHETAAGIYLVAIEVLKEWGIAHPEGVLSEWRGSPWDGRGARYQDNL